MAMQATRGLFVTGTDTDVGKTIVAASVFTFLRKARTAVPFKPVQTGAYRISGAWRSPDIDFVLRTANLELNPRHYRMACPYCYRAACSPHLAARLARRPISIARILRAARQLHTCYEFIVAEGAGGVMVPISSRAVMLDIMRSLRLPVLVAARAGLGTLNHTLLTVRAIQDANLPVLGITLWAARWGYIEESNLQTLRARTGLAVLKFPYCPSVRHGRLSAADLARTQSSVRELLVPWLKTVL